MASSSDTSSAAIAAPVTDELNRRGTIDEFVEDIDLAVIAHTAQELRRARGDARGDGNQNNFPDSVREDFADFITEIEQAFHNQMANNPPTMHIGDLGGQISVNIPNLNFLARKIITSVDIMLVDIARIHAEFLTPERGTTNGVLEIGASVQASLARFLQKAMFMDLLVVELSKEEDQHLYLEETFSQGPTNKEVALVWVLKKIMVKDLAAVYTCGADMMYIATVIIDGEEGQPWGVNVWEPLVQRLAAAGF